MMNNCKDYSITSGGISHAKNDCDAAFDSLFGCATLETGADLKGMLADVLNDKAKEFGCHPDDLREEMTADNRNSAAPFVQRLENLPQELLSQARWFPVREDKKPKIGEWQKPENQRLPQDVRGLKGFDTCGRGQAADFLFLDFDHVLTDEGKFVNVEAEFTFDEIRNEFDHKNFFCERSISGHGLHVLLLPTAGKFDAVNAGRKGTLHFGDGNAKLEIFYGGKARYMLATGNLFCCDKGATIAQGETVDKVFRRLLRDVQKEIDATGDPGSAPQQDKPQHRDDKHNLCEDTEEYKQFRIQRMLDTIIPAELEYTEWIKVNSACKNEDVPYSIVDAFNRRDTTVNAKGEPRYNETENLRHWDSFTNPNYDIHILHTIAQRFGYSEHDTWHEFHDDKRATKSATPQSGDRANEVSDNTETVAGVEEIIGKIRDACEWRGVKDSNGNFKPTSIKPTQSNLDLIFGNDPYLKGLVGYDQFSGVNVFLKRAPWHDTDCTGEQWDDTDDAQLRVYLRRMYADLEHAKRIEDSRISHSRDNAFNAVKQFLESLPKWDDEERAATVLVKFLHAEDSEYTRTVTMNFLIGAIARVYHPGCDFQTCLVLQGAQRIGKSKLVKMLGGKEGVNPNGQDWHVALKDSVDDSHATDALMKGWIIEIEEFSAARKAEINALKSFISANEDTRRFSYDRYASTRLRHCVFVVTCNDQQFLRDPTGNARFISVQCSKKKFDRVAGMTPAYIRQVWAEALVKYRELFIDGFNEAKLMLPLKIQIQAEEIAETFTQDDGMTTEITAYLDRKIPQQALWLLLSREERRKFFVNGGSLEMFNAWDELKARRTARGGRNLQADLEQLQDICAGKFGNTRRDGTSTFFYGAEYRNHICAVEIFNECFGQDKRKSMLRINEILSNMSGWTLGKRLRNADPEYSDMKKVFYRDEDNIPDDDTADEPADKFTSEPINPDDIPPFD